MGHTHLSFVVEITFIQTSKSFIMYKLFVLAAVLAAATAEGYYPAGYAGIGGLYANGLAGLPYGAYGAYGYGGALAAPAAYGYAGLAAPAFAAAPVVAAPLPAPRQYAVPAPRVVAEAPIVEKIVEPVEQWGYKIKY